MGATIKPLNKSVNRILIPVQFLLETKIKTELLLQRYSELYEIADGHFVLATDSKGPLALECLLLMSSIVIIKQTKGRIELSLCVENKGSIPNLAYLKRLGTVSGLPRKFDVFSG